nr:MAG TPA_asm: hypothetical protein [Caudoviricetes sp.]
MKKYNCNNTLDYVHEATRMCGTFSECSGCQLAGLHCELYEIIPEHIKRVQAWSDAHPETVLTDKQVEIFKALNLLGYKYIAHDKNKDIAAYFSEPYKGRKSWEAGAFRLEIHSNAREVISPLVSWDDAEPLNIAEALEQAEEANP